jgi:FAD/FMN-containing dehydrogenase
MRVIRYGMMREQVLGVEAVLPDGRIVSSMNSMLKNNTGYDLKQLFIGSEGTLGVITRLVLRIRENPRSCNTAMVAVPDMATVARLLRTIDAGLGGQLSAFELIDNDFFGVNTTEGRIRSPLADLSPFYVIIESLGADQERDAAMFEAVLADALESGLVSDAVIAGSERERAELWSIRETLEHVVSDFTPFYAFDVSLAVGEMEGYMRNVRGLLAERFPDGRIAFLGHVGDGNLHIAIGAGGPDDRHAVESCVYSPLTAIGGSISAEHGIGLEKKPWLHISRSEVEISVMRELKNLFDPHGILNPGKIFKEDAG